MACPDCGFDAPTVAPADALAAVRSYPRRWRALLVRPDDADPEILRRRPAAGEPSALDHGAAAAAGMQAAAVALGAIQSHDDPPVDLEPPPAAGGRTLDDVLGAITSAAGALADAIDAVHGEGWARTGRLPDGRPVRALDAARSGVHAGSHHLRAADRALAGVRLRFDPEDEAD